MINKNHALDLPWSGRSGQAAALLIQYSLEMQTEYFLGAVDQAVYC